MMPAIARPLLLTFLDPPLLSEDYVPPTSLIVENMDSVRKSYHRVID